MSNKSKLLRTKRIFLAHLKSKLLSPVEAIIGYSEIVLEGVAETANHFINRDILRILHSGIDLLTYVQDIIHLSANDNHYELPSASVLAESSHQIRTYLNLIIGYCELLIEDLEASAPRRLLNGLEKIKQASQDLLHSIDEILSFSSVQFGEQTLNEKTLQSDDMIQNVVNTISSVDADKKAVVTGIILVVDDVEANRDILSSRLSRKGHFVTTASSGAEALEILQEQHFDLVILDILMSDLNGYQVLKKINLNPALKDTAVIIHSAVDELVTIVRCLEMGAEDYLVKPTNMVLFNARVNSCLEKKSLMNRERKIAQQLEQQQSHLNNELMEAAEYVKSLIPEPFSSNGICAEWLFFPSSFLGGDSLGYHWIDPDHFACYVVDVCGHGIGSALLSVSVLNTLNADNLQDIDIRDPSQVMAALNQTFTMENQGGKYFTMWYGVYHQKTHTLRYASAGHPPAMLLHNDDTQQPDITLLNSGGAPITGFDGAYDSAEVILPPWAKLYIFSDGVYEIKMADGHMLSYSEFVTLVTPEPGQPPKELDDIIDMMQALAAEPNDDDVSLLSFTFRDLQIM